MFVNDAEAANTELCDNKGCRVSLPPDYRLHQRGDEKGQPLRAEHDQHDLDQPDELRGVEQEGRAGDRTSHQTLEGMRTQFQSDTIRSRIEQQVANAATVTARPDKSECFEF